MWFGFAFHAFLCCCSTSLGSISTAAASAPPPTTAALSGDYSRLVGFANANAAFAAIGRPAASVPS